MLLLPVVLWVDGAARRRRLAVFATAALVGVGVSGVGNAFYWDHFIRLARRVQAAWLGEPDRSGAVIDERGRGHRDSCLEDTYGLLWLPQFQPIVGHAWLLRHAVAGHDWARAQHDAPWSRHTSLQFELDSTYRRARLDWWPATWEPRDRPVGWGTLAGFAGCIVLGGVLGFAARRREDDAPRTDTEPEA